MQHPASIAIDDLLRNCQIRRTRRGGPGGQHRNKVETAVVITHNPTGISAEASERRSQEYNRKIAIHRLRVRLALNVRTERNTPSDLWLSRCRGGRIAINPNHDDFPTILAEALDWITQLEYEVNVAAKQLNCSTSQLVKLLKLSPAAFEQVNANRADRQRNPLK